MSQSETTAETYSALPIADDFSAQEKAAKVTWLFAHEHEMTASDVARRFAMTPQGAYKLLWTISRVVPIAPDGQGRWKSFCNST